MKLMQNEYPMIAKIEIEMTQEMEMDCLPIRASKSGFTYIKTINAIFSYTYLLKFVVRLKN